MIRLLTRAAAPRTLRLLLAAFAVVAAYAVTPAVASAAPAPATAAATTHATGLKPAASPFTVLSTKADPKAMTPIPDGTRRAVVSQYSCSYRSQAPGYTIDFTCTVFTGAISIFLQCTDPNIRGNSPALPAPGTYNLRAVCGPPAIWSFFNVVDA